MPAFDPPFDDERSQEVWATADQLAFDWSGLTAQKQPKAPAGGTITAAPGTASTRQMAGFAADPVRPGGTPGASGTLGAGGTPAAGRTPGDGGGTPGAPDGEARAATAGGSPVAGASVEAKIAVRRFVAICVEVLNGYRPAAHLRRLSTPGEAAGVVAQALAGARRVSEMRRATGRAVRTTTRHGRRPDPVAVRRLRLCEPRPGAVEAAVLLITGDRTWALALRLEQHQQSWVATTLRLI